MIYQLTKKAICFVTTSNALNIALMSSSYSTIFWLSLYGNRRNCIIVLFKPKATRNTFWILGNQKHILDTRKPEIYPGYQETRNIYPGYQETRNISWILGNRKYILDTRKPEIYPGY